MMTLKERLKTICIQRLEDKISAFRTIVSDMSADAQTDAKSSAGDKHETGLAMMHIEQENLSKKIKENLDILEVVSKIDEKKVSDKVEFGSVVKINSVTLFFSAALPKIILDDMSVMAISNDAPIAKELLGRKLNETFVFNNCEFKVNYIE